MKDEISLVQEMIQTRISSENLNSLRKYSAKGRAEYKRSNISLWFEGKRSFFEEYASLISFASNCMPVCQPHIVITSRSHFFLIWWDGC